MSGKNKTYIDNEVEFLRCSGLETRVELEDLFLKNRISYFIRFEKANILARIFKSRHAETVIFCINSRDVDFASELVEGMPGVEIIGKAPEEDWSPKRALREREGDNPSSEGGEDPRKRGIPADPLAVNDEDNEGDEAY